MLKPNQSLISCKLHDATTSKQHYSSINTLHSYVQCIHKVLKARIEGETTHCRLI